MSSDASLLPAQNSHTLSAHAGPVHSVRYNHDGNYLLTAGSDRTVRLWNPESGLCIKTYEGHGKEVYNICVPPAASDNSRFASCSGDRSVFVWDVGTGRPTRRFTGHHQRVNAIAFNAEATVIVSGSYDATVRCWDCRANSRLPIQVLDHAKDSVESVQILGSYILTGSVDGYIRTYDIRMGDVTSDKVGHPVSSAVYSGDENCVLATCLDDTLRLFDKDNGELLNEYKGHKNNSYRLISTLSYTDAHVVSGSEDGRICIWDLVEGDLVKSIAAHERAVTCVAYHPREHRMCSGSVDGKVKVWSNEVPEAS
ncbi:WD40-repeat-containing domain protein [Phlyctochytrium arcticum]|nr:WD40-repeat-containing domain protein [Phlyctochytrium arcticum]